MCTSVLRKEVSEDRQYLGGRRTQENKKKSVDWKRFGEKMEEKDTPLHKLPKRVEG